jgi:Holliday junction resolvase
VLKNAMGEKLIEFLQKIEAKEVVLIERKGDFKKIISKYFSLITHLSLDKADEIQYQIKSDSYEEWMQEATQIIQRSIVLFSPDKRMAFMDKEYLCAEL